MLQCGELQCGECSSQGWHSGSDNHAGGQLKYCACRPQVWGRICDHSRGARCAGEKAETRGDPAETRGERQNWRGAAVSQAASCSSPDPPRSSLFFTPHQLHLMKLAASASESTSTTSNAIFSWLSLKSWAYEPPKAAKAKYCWYMMWFSLEQ